MYLLTLSFFEALRLRFGGGYPLSLPDWDPIAVPWPDEVILVARVRRWGLPPDRPERRIHALLQAGTVAVRGPDGAERPVLKRIRWRSLPSAFSLEGIQVTRIDYFEERALVTLDPDDAAAVADSGLLQPALTAMACAPPRTAPTNWLWAWSANLFLDGTGRWLFPPDLYQFATEWLRTRRRSPTRPVRSGWRYLVRRMNDAGRRRLARVGGWCRERLERIDDDLARRARIYRLRNVGYRLDLDHRRRIMVDPFYQEEWDTELLCRAIRKGAAKRKAAERKRKKAQSHA